MKNRLLIYLLMLGLSAPALFSCSSTKEYYSFGPATGKYNGSEIKKSNKNTNVAALENTEKAAEAKNTAATTKPVSGLPAAEANLGLTASSDLATAPDTELNSVTAKMQAATQEAEQQKETAAIANQKEVKLNFLQKLALKKMQKKLQKSVDNQVQKSVSAEKPGLLNKLLALDQNLKMALIFILVGAVLFIIPGPVGYILGTIAIVVGLIFLILWVAGL